MGQPPNYEPAELKDDDDLSELCRSWEEYRKRLDDWSAKHDEAYRQYSAKLLKVGDNFAGEDVNGKWKSYLGVPRLVSMTGILYQARCELVHEGKLSGIRVVPADDEATLNVSGVDPIEFSSTWVSHVLGIVTVAKENKGLLSKTVMETTP